jgi:hypothetical protein
MSKPTVVLFGTLVGGMGGSRGDSTGYILKMPDLDVDTRVVWSAEEYAGRPCVVAGTFEERASPSRGRVRVLRAAQISATATGLSRKSLRSTVFLPGTLRLGVARPDGEGRDAGLTGVAPEVDVTAVPRAGLVGQFVAATGAFVLTDCATRGLQFVFKVAELERAKEGQE